MVLFNASPGAEQDEAWPRFVSTYSGLLLHTCQTVAREHDAAMDGYGYLLDALRDEDYRRLRAYRPVPGVRFTTWLVVITRRLLLAERFNDDRPARDIAAAITVPTAFHAYRRLGSVRTGLKAALPKRGMDEPPP